MAAVDNEAEAGTEAEPAPNRLFWQWTTVAVVVGLVVRVVWVVWVHRQPQGLYDPARYFGYADRIARGKGYIEGFTGQVTSYYPPGYPWFLGIVNTVLRHTPLSDDLPLMGGLVQAAIGAAGVALGAVIARRMVGPIAGIVAAFGLALYPNLVFHTGVLLSETLYNFLFMAFLFVLLVRPWPSGLTAPRIAGAAVLLGLAILVRPISVAILPVLAIVWWVQVRDWRTVLRWTGITIAVVIACILPWTIRNAIRMHAFVPISTNTGDNLCIGHSPQATGGFSFSEACNTGEGVQSGTKAELRSDHTKTSRGLRFFRQRIGHEPYLIGQRTIDMFENDHDAVSAAESYRCTVCSEKERRAANFMSAGTRRLLIRVADISYYVVGAVGLIGLARLAWSGRPDRLLLVLSGLATAAVPILFFFGDPRFKVPVMPLVVIAAACAVTRWPRRADVAA
jgi:hypothetical protein